MNNLLLGMTKTKPHQVYYTLLWKYYTNYSMRLQISDSETILEVSLFDLYILETEIQVYLYLPVQKWQKKE